MNKTLRDLLIILSPIPLGFLIILWLHYNKDKKPSKEDEKK